MNEEMVVGTALKTRNFVRVQHSTGVYSHIDVNSISFVLDPGHYQEFEVEVSKKDEEGNQIVGETVFEIQNKKVGEPGFFTVICDGTPTLLVADPETPGGELVLGYDDLLGLCKGV